MADDRSVAPLRLLVINPNTSQPMTEALKPMVHDLGYTSVSYTYFTCPPPGIPSINSPSDAEASAKHCLPHLIPLLPHHDAFLIACYSQHPLVPILRFECDKLASAATKVGSGARKYVTGIFEASVVASLNLLAGAPLEDKFGIVSTGKIWEDALTVAVEEFLNIKTHLRNGGGKFIGVETTGLSAVELHDLPAEVVRQKMVQATERLARWACQEKAYSRKLAAVCLGCAGMVGLEDAVRQGCTNVMGDEEGKKVRIVDGVKAGVGLLVAMARGGF